MNRFMAHGRRKGVGFALASTGWGRGGRGEEDFGSERNHPGDQASSGWPTRRPRPRRRDWHFVRAQMARRLRGATTTRFSPRWPPATTRFSRRGPGEALSLYDRSLVDASALSLVLVGLVMSWALFALPWLADE